MKCKKLVPCHDCKGKGYITLALGVDDLCGIGSKTCESCNGLGEVWETMTNADRIRSMSDKELVEYIGYNSLCDRLQGYNTWCAEHTVCEICLAKWLQQPAEEST